MAGYDLSTDRLYGHVKVRKGRTEFLAFLSYLRSLHPASVRIAIVLDNFSPHLSTKNDQRVGDWAAANNVELAYMPTYSSWLNRIEAQFQALRYFAIDGTDHATHREQAPHDPPLHRTGGTTTPTTAPYVNWSSAQTLPDTALGQGESSSAAHSRTRVTPRPRMRAFTERWWQPGHSSSSRRPATWRSTSTRKLAGRPSWQF